jgi:heat shock protein HtpX
MYFSIFAGGRRDREGGGTAILAILAIILVPICAMLVRLAISRGREYGADEDGARISRKPSGLANALRKLESAAHSKRMQQGNPSTAHMFIVNPFAGVRLSSLFSTHPPTDERIKRLEELAKTGNF